MYYFSLTKIYLLSALSIFSDITLRYVDRHGDAKMIQPKFVLPFASKRFMFYNSFMHNKRKDGNNQLYMNMPDEVKVSQILPILTLSNIQFGRAAEIQQNKFNHIKNGKLKSATPVFYNLSFDVSIITKNMIPNLQFIEQTIPKFAKGYSYRIEKNLPLIKDLNTNLILESVTPTLPTDLGDTDDRITMTEFNLKMTVPYFSNYLELGKLSNEMVVGNEKVLKIDKSKFTDEMDLELIESLDNLIFGNYVE